MFTVTDKHGKMMHVKKTKLMFVLVGLEIKRK
jgi:hypothetical protein